MPSVLLFSLSVFFAESAEIISSCFGQDDGVYLMKLIDSDDYPIVEARCSNEYVIIDYSTDNSWSEYFSSFTKYHYGIAGSTRNDHSNWNSWFTPHSEHESYLVSRDCTVCDSTHYMQKYDEGSTFYMNALAFACFNPTRGWPSCDMDYETYECRICKWNDAKTQITWEERDYQLLTEIDSDYSVGVCDFEIMESSQEVLTTMLQCTTYSQGTADTNFRPSIGVDGRQCQCYKNENSHMITVPNQEYNDKLDSLGLQSELDEQHELDDLSSDNNIIYLTQNDFEYGTYRIKESGTYVVTEDIVFDFNAGSMDDPLSDDAWWPRSGDDVEYPGSRQARGSYFLGFFAGITIETSDVVLDLNGHSLSMSPAFFYSQPFFSVIELASQPFLPQQGSGFFGSDPTFASNVVIKNGILGLTSHHSIHGNYNEDIRIENMQIRDFQTHGIQLNGFTDVVIRDTDVGPTTEIAYLNGYYAHLRLLLPFLRKIAYDKPYETISFNGRKDTEYTMQDLIDILEPMMVKAFTFVMTEEKDNSNDDWREIYEIFINPSGLAYGAVTYGIFLNYPNAGIFGWHVNDATSDGALLENVRIHDLYRQGMEVVGLQKNMHVFCTAFNGALPVEFLVGDWKIATAFSDLLYADDDDSTDVDDDGSSDSTDDDDDVIYLEYHGNIMTDIHIAMWKFGSDNFDNFPGIPWVGDSEELIGWAQGRPESHDTFASSNTDEMNLYCNSDAMFHPAKGTLAMKIGGVQNVVINGLTIENIVDLTPMGHDVCGSKDGYSIAQQAPYQIGFSLNMVMGIAVDFSDVTLIDKGLSMDGIWSKNGLSYGLSTWYSTTVKYETDAISISNIHAGFGAELTGLAYTDRPNKAPESCAIRMYSDDEDNPVSHLFGDDVEESDIYIACATGDVGCVGDSDVYTHIGSSSKHVCNKKPENIPTGLNEQESSSQLLWGSGWDTPLFYCIFAMIILIILCVSKRVFHDRWTKKQVNSLLDKSGYQSVSQKDENNEYGTF